MQSRLAPSAHSLQTARNPRISSAPAEELCLSAFPRDTPADERVKGIVLTSSIGGTRGLRSLPPGRITVPELVVHHRDDAYPASSFRDAAQMSTLITHSPRVTLVEVRGGLASAADPCEPCSAQGYIGIEPQVVEAIAEWISGHSVPARIGP